ncbi:S-adenosyl-L-methionine-dependent methyltransferase [Delphinella strobiligena]|nr:S-adenosyl-L-methionine-dependent methyltransferase [Delphinella strobiligena]
MSSSAALNPLAQSGFAKAAEYDAHRPTFPAESVNVLLENVRIADKPGATVIDLAAGTGKFTQALVDRPEQYKVTAVEPHAHMRKVLENKKLKDVEFLDGLSTSIPLADESVDAVIAAQAFHWFANMESLQEINRVLQPHGAFGAVWNIEDYNAPRSYKARSAWEEKLHEVIWSKDDDQPRFRHEKWRSVFDEQIQSNPISITTTANPLFALPLGEHVHEWQIWLSKEAVWDRFNTLSQIAILEGEERERVYKIYSDAINAPDVETNDKGEVAIHGRTFSVWTTKIPQDGARAIISEVIDAVKDKLS